MEGTLFPIKIDVIKDGYYSIPIFITTTYDGFWTIYPGIDVKVKIPNSYPRFTTIEKTEEYWNSIKHKFNERTKSMDSI